MADIRSFLREKEKREENQENYKVKIRKHRFSAFARVMMVLLVIGALAALVIIQYRNHIYTGYETVSVIERQSSSGATDIRLGDAILTYSKDGAHCTDLKGNVVWNQTYGIQDILISINQDAVAIADYNGREIYVMNSQKQLGSFTTTMPIRSISVSSQGNVAVYMADTDQEIFRLYDYEGKELYDGKATMNDSGYPIAMSQSPDGNLMAVSYIYLDAGVQKTNVAFYNWGPVGDNQNDNLMGVYTYTDLLVPYVQYMNNNTVFMVGDSRLMIYQGTQKPVMAAEFLYSTEVRSVFYNEEYIGLVFYSDDAQSRYKINVYDADAKQVGSYYFDIDYTDIFFHKDTFTVYNDSECMIKTLDGVVKYSGSFAKTVKKMIPLKSAYKYVILTNDSLDTIQLK